MPCRTPGMPFGDRGAARRFDADERAPVSTKPAKVPAALEPPPTQATTTSGSAPSSRSAHWPRGFVADDALQLAHHVGEGMGSHDRAEAVVRRVDRGHPLPHGFVHSVLQGPAARRHGADLGTEELHPEHVELLALGVHLAHEHRAFEAEERGRRGRGDAVLAGPGLCDHAPLAHALGQQRLSDDVVQLVRARVRQVLPLEQDADAEALRQAPALGDRASDGPRSAAAARPARIGRPGRPRRRRTISPVRGRPASVTRGRSGPRIRRSGRRRPGGPSGSRSSLTRPSSRRAPRPWLPRPEGRGSAGWRRPPARWR